MKERKKLTLLPEDQAAFIIYKRLAVHFYHSDTASLASRQSDIREAAEHFALTFFPWADPSLAEQEKDEDLVKIMASALEISIWLYGQPYNYEFMWEDPGFRGTAITPGLTRTTDARGRKGDEVRCFWSGGGDRWGQARRRFVMVGSRGEEKR